MVQHISKLNLTLAVIISLLLILSVVEAASSVSAQDNIFVKIANWFKSLTGKSINPTGDASAYMLDPIYTTNLSNGVNTQGIPPFGGDVIQGEMLRLDAYNTTLLPDSPVSVVFWSGLHELSTIISNFSQNYNPMMGGYRFYIPTNSSYPVSGIRGSCVNTSVYGYGYGQCSGGANFTVYAFGYGNYPNSSSYNGTVVIIPDDFFVPSISFGNDFYQYTNISDYSPYSSYNGNTYNPIESQISTIRVNINYSDQGLGVKNITVRLYNTSTNLLNSTTFTNLNNSRSGSVFVNYTYLLPLNYTLNATACDFAGNCNSTSTRGYWINNFIYINSTYVVNSSGVIGGDVVRGGNATIYLTLKSGNPAAVVLSLYSSNMNYVPYMGWGEMNEQYKGVARVFMNRVSDLVWSYNLETNDSLNYRGNAGSCIGYFSGDNTVPSYPGNTHPTSSAMPPLTYGQKYCMPSNMMNAYGLSTRAYGAEYRVYVYKNYNATREAPNQYNSPTFSYGCLGQYDNGYAYGGSVKHNAFVLVQGTASTKPTVTFSSDANNGTLDQKYIYTNFTVVNNGAGVKNLSVYLYTNVTGTPLLINTTTFTGYPYKLNYSLSSNNVYLINATARDHSNYSSSSETRRIELKETVVNNTTPDNAPSSGGTSTSGGSYEPLSNRTATEEVVKEGYATSLREGEGIHFNVGSQSHSVTVRGIIGTMSAIVLIQSTPIEVALSVGEVKYVDIDGSNLSVRLNSISAGKADVTVKLVPNLTTASITQVEEVKETPVTETPSSEASASSNVVKFLMVLGVIVLLVVIVVIVAMKAGKQEQVVTKKGKKK